MRATSRLAALLVSAALLSSRPATLDAMSVVHTPLAADVDAAETYRLYIYGADGVASQHVELTLEQDLLGITGVLRAGAFSSALQGVRVEDGVLHATVTTTSGQGTLEFHPFVDHPYGTLTLGSRTLVIKEAGSR